LQDKENIKTDSQKSHINQSKNAKAIRSERLTIVGELTARLAHDLRNPLTVIKGIVEIAKIKSNDPQKGFSPSQLLMMERAISSMSRQIDDVLEFVKVPTLHTSCNSLLETIGLSIIKIPNTSELIIDIPANDVEFVYDTEKLVVFDNLLRNAAEAIENKGTITIRVDELENEVIIEIEDSGPGVPDELLDKIFEPLFTTKQRGTGLGLASCKSIIEQHGGIISVKNRPSVFTIKLPKVLEIETI
jgi:signal transduction histidine kinase